MPATASGTGESAGTPLGSARPEYPRPLGRAAGPDLGAEGGHSSVFFFFFWLHHSAFLFPNWGFLKYN